MGFLFLNILLVILLRGFGKSRFHEIIYEVTPHIAWLIAINQIFLHLFNKGVVTPRWFFNIKQTHICTHTHTQVSSFHRVPHHHHLYPNHARTCHLHTHTCTRAYSYYMNIVLPFTYPSNEPPSTLNNIFNTHAEIPWVGRYCWIFLCT